MFTIIPLTIHPHQSIHDFSPIIFISSWKSEHILILKLQYMNSVVTVTYHTETGDLKSYSITKSYFSSVIMVLILRKHDPWPGWHSCSNETMWHTACNEVECMWLGWPPLAVFLAYFMKAERYHTRTHTCIYTHTHKSLVNVFSGRKTN